MFNADYIVEQSTAIHADNRAKGFWEQPRTVQMLRGLITSEIFEAFDGTRKGKKATSVDFLYARLMELQNCAPSDKAYLSANYALSYESNVKDTPEAEMAGTCIRCFDAIGGRVHEGNGRMIDVGCGREDGFTIEEIGVAAAARIEFCLKGAGRVTAPEDLEIFPEVLMGMVPPAMGLQTQCESFKYGLAQSITELNSYVETLKNMAVVATWYGIDLPTFIALEVAYNRTRPHKHGNNKF